jgi:hypothetical protein
VEACKALAAIEMAHIDFEGTFESSGSMALVDGCE